MTDLDQEIKNHSASILSGGCRMTITDYSVGVSLLKRWKKENPKYKHLSESKCELKASYRVVLNVIKET